MSEWSNFIIVITGQIVFLLFLYRTQGEKLPRPSIIARVLIAGIVFGGMFDLFFGHALGIFGYVIPASATFLIVNGALSYGVAMLSVMVLNHKTFLGFYVWSIVLAAWYEIVNFIWPLWAWSFTQNLLFQEIVLIFAAYCGLSMLMAAFLTVSVPMKFQWFPFGK